MPVLLLDTDLAGERRAGPADHPHPVRPRPRDAPPPGARPRRRRRAGAPRARPRAGGLAPQRGPLRVPARRARPRATSRPARRSTTPGPTSGATACSRSTRPVSAGNERFDADLVRRVAGPLLDARRRPGRAASSSSGVGVDGDRGQFDMTAFCLRLTNGANAVSQLHARDRQRDLAGRHRPRRSSASRTGPHPDLGRRSRCASCSSATSTPTSTTSTPSTRQRPLLGAPRARSRRATCGRRTCARSASSRIFARGRLRSQFARHGEAPSVLAELETALDPDVLTIGFARRFATYKRAGLLFTDIDRLAPDPVGRGPAGPGRLRRQGPPGRPARPAGDPGDLPALALAPSSAAGSSSSRTTTCGSARFLVQGVDVWLNNPRRPLEASGTSGHEGRARTASSTSASSTAGGTRAATGDNGWAIGGRETDPDEGAQDWADAQDLYRILEEEIVPAYYERDADGLPPRWLAVMRRAMATRDLALLDDPDAPRVHRAALPAGRRRRRRRGRGRRRAGRHRSRLTGPPMAPRISLALAIHNHQPVGNFGWVFAEVYEQAYLPMLEALERHPGVRLSLHYTGPLLDWLRAERPEFIERLRALVDRGQVELLGGGYYEPVLASLPERDRIGQLRRMARRARGASFGPPAARAPGWPSGSGSRTCRPRSSPAGYGWTILDDAHFRAAAIPEEDLWGPYTTEDQGHLLTRLRHGAGPPLPDPVPATSRTSSTTCATTRPRTATRVGMMGDDGEKFGAWPTTWEHCWGERPLGRALLRGARGERRLADDDRPRRPGSTATRRSAASTSRPARTPRWASGRCRPTRAVRLRRRSSTRRRGGAPARGALAARRRSGATSRSSTARSTTSTSRCCGRRRKVAAMPDGPDRDARARPPLPGQSNDCYWHGLFGGIYISHMRLATYEHLIAAEDARRHAPPARSTRPSAATSTSTGVDEVRLADAGPGRDGRPRRGRRDRRLGHPGRPPRAGGGPAPPARGLPRDAARATRRPAAAAGGAAASAGDGAGLDPRHRHDQGGGPRGPAPLRPVRAPLRPRPLPGARDATPEAWATGRATSSSATPSTAPFEVDDARRRTGSSSARDGVGRRRRPVRVDQDDPASAATAATPTLELERRASRTAAPSRSRRGSASSGRLTMLGGGGNPAAWYEVDGERDRARRDAGTAGGVDGHRAGQRLRRRRDRDDASRAAGRRLVGADRDRLELRGAASSASTRAPALLLSLAARRWRRARRDGDASATRRRRRATAPRTRRPPTAAAAMSRGRLVVHGHFYQPSRVDPFSGPRPGRPVGRAGPRLERRGSARSATGPNAERGNLGAHLVGPRADARRLARGRRPGRVSRLRRRATAGVNGARPALPPRDPAARVGRATGGPRSAGACATSSSGSAGRPTGHVAARDGRGPADAADPGRGGHRRTRSSRRGRRRRRDLDTRRPYRVELGGGRSHRRRVLRRRPVGGGLVRAAGDGRRRPLRPRADRAAACVGGRSPTTSRRSS